MIAKSVTYEAKIEGRFFSTSLVYKRTITDLERVRLQIK